MEFHCGVTVNLDSGGKMHNECVLVNDTCIMKFILEISSSLKFIALKNLQKEQ